MRKVVPHIRNQYRTYCMLMALIWFMIGRGRRSVVASM